VRIWHLVPVSHPVRLCSSKGSPLSPLHASARRSWAGGVLSVKQTSSRGAAGRPEAGVFFDKVSEKWRAEPNPPHSPHQFVTRVPITRPCHRTGFGLQTIRTSSRSPWLARAPKTSQENPTSPARHNLRSSSLCDSCRSL